jgi:hypothetical protein
MVWGPPKEFGGQLLQVWWIFSSNKIGLTNRIKDFQMMCLPMTLRIKGRFVYSVQNFEV